MEELLRKFVKYIQRHDGAYYFECMQTEKYPYDNEDIIIFTEEEKEKMLSYLNQ